MKRNTLITTLGLVATMGATALLPTMASASVQNDKNNARNLEIAGAVIAGYGLLNHNTGATLLGAAGALIGNSQYQKDQNIENNWNNRWDRDNRDRGYNGGYDNRDYHRDGGYDNRDYHQNYDRDRDGR